MGLERRVAALLLAGAQARGGVHDDQRLAQGEQVGAEETLVLLGFAAAHQVGLGLVVLRCLRRFIHLLLILSVKG